MFILLTAKPPYHLIATIQQIILFMHHRLNWDQFPNSIMLVRTQIYSLYALRTDLLEFITHFIPVHTIKSVLIFLIHFFDNLMPVQVNEYTGINNISYRKVVKGVRLEEFMVPIGVQVAFK